jgi:hypothetical protein
LPEFFLALVTDKDLPYDISRIYSKFLERNDLQWSVMVFRKIAEAEAWIKERVKEKHGLDLKVTEYLPPTS